MLDSRGARRFPHCMRGLLGSALAIAMCGCGTASPPSIIATPNHVEESEAVGNADRGVSGVWQGISVSGCVGDPSDPGRCAAMQKITLTMFQEGTEVTGFYKCAFGNQVCRHLNESGVIRNGTLKRTRLMMRVMHDDGSMCFFSGRYTGDRLDGGYECLQGGGIIEQGTFQTRRRY
jgi:hypothetical protein